MNNIMLYRSSRNNKIGLSEIKQFKTNSEIFLI